MESTNPAEPETDRGSQEDVLCPECGAVMEGGFGESVCSECGHELVRKEDLKELDEADVDVEDLARHRPPEVWDPEFEAGPESLSALESGDGSSRATGFFGASLFQNLFAGVISGGLAFFFAVAMAMLATAQSGMHQFLPFVLSATLAAMAVGSAFYSLQSRIPFGLAGSGTVVTAMMFFFLGAVYRNMAGRFEPDIILSTLVAAIVLSSVVVGVGLWLIGILRAGKLIRYVPVQIIGGVIGGIGIYVLAGAFDWMGGLGLHWGNLLSTAQECIEGPLSGGCLLNMVPSLVFGLLLFFGLSRCKNSLFLFCLLLVACAAGYGVSFWGTGQADGPFSTSVADLASGVPLYSLDVLKMGLGDVQWDIIRAHGLYLGALGCIAALTGMYRVTKLELVLGGEVDFSRELRALGVVNVLSGLCGGMPAGISFGRSAGAKAIGGSGPFAGVVAGLVVLTGLYFANTVMLFIPRFVPEGMLVFAGLALVRGWMFKARTAFTRRNDLWMLWVTFFATVVFGLLIGTGFGVALALMVTVRRSSKGGPVRNVLSGVAHRSSVDRASTQQRVLREYGDHIHILRLHGFLFLGSMEELLLAIRQRLDDRSLLPVEYLVLDFKMVTGLASATEIGFRKLNRLAEEYSFEPIIASAPLELEQHLEQAGFLGGEEDAFKVFYNLEYAMEWCENRVLDAEGFLDMHEMALPDLLMPVFPEPKYIPALMKVLKRVTFKKGETVFAQGDVSDAMYFVESGKLDVELSVEGGRVIRLKKVGPGAVVGEMGIYTAAPRSATVRATEKCVLYLMTLDKLEAVEKRAPMLVTAIHRFMINLLAERLAEANFKVHKLMG
ncbi:SulP family inorganic anion transporter [Pseudodesulfovibrio cashew]|nr:SulP family inorganic anion transporter [Pseudodesulfovibrio cashew]